MAPHTTTAGVTECLALPRRRAGCRVVDRVGGSRGENVAERLVRAVETVDVVEHDGSTHGVMASVQGMVGTHHGISSASAPSPSCMGHPVTVQEQIGACQMSEILEIIRNINYKLQQLEESNILYKVGGRLQFITYDYLDFCPGSIKIKNYS